MDYKIILYIFFGILPSLAWFFYYLRKDLHPESKKMILKVFLLGTLVTVPVFFAQVGLAILLQKINAPAVLTNILYWFVVISFTEEVFKFLIVKFEVLRNSEFDEPVDTMIYMIIVALGFAALENILYLFTPIDQISFNEAVNRTVVITIIRFLGATFLHTLCSALIGFFLAISFKESKKYIWIIGIFFAVLLHGIYNFSIMSLEGPLKFGVPIAVLVSLAIFVMSGFEKIKKIKSICLIK